MRNIYNIMKQSIVQAEDGTYYPDVCTLDFQEFSPQYGTKGVSLSQNDLNRLDLLPYKMYGINEFEDLILMLNNIDYYKNVEVNETIIIYDLIDIEQFYNNNLQ